LADRHSADSHLADRHLVDRHLADRNLDNIHLVKNIWPIYIWLTDIWSTGIRSVDIRSVDIWLGDIWLVDKWLVDKWLTDIWSTDIWSTKYTKIIVDQLSVDCCIGHSKQTLCRPIVCRSNGFRPKDVKPILNTLGLLGLYFNLVPCGIKLPSTLFILWPVGATTLSIMALSIMTHSITIRKCDTEHKV
jgi:hypothetical protein